MLPKKGRESNSETRASCLVENAVRDRNLAKTLKLLSFLN